jgi:hypothetical protein
MLTFRFLSRSFFIAVLAATAFSQSNPLKVAPLPNDPFELATGPAEIVSSPEGRVSVLGLLEKARQNADLIAPGAPPFTLKTSFSAEGAVLFTGSGEMEETWLSPRDWEWSARLGDFAFKRVMTGGIMSDDRAISMIPMRVQMLRDSLFWPMNFENGTGQIRTIQANWQGQTVTCILTSAPFGNADPTPGRRWVEQEYCIDKSSGTLRILSEAPGVYTVFEYRNAIRFHGHLVPDDISVIEGGKTILNARIESIGDAGIDAAVLEAQKPRGGIHGPVLSASMRFPQIIRVAPGAGVIQPVIVHAILASDGKVLDAELLDNSGAELTRSALETVKRTTYVRARRRTQGPLQREAFINVKFVSGESGGQN